MESVGNQIFWRRQVMSVERMIVSKDGEVTDYDSVCILNKCPSPSTEDECIAMENIMNTTIDFTNINMNQVPFTLSQTALDVLAKAKTEVDVLEFSEYLNEHGNLTVEAAKKFIEENPSTTPLTVPEILEQAEYKGDHIERCTKSANKAVASVLRPAYWVALMTRENTGGYNNNPPTYEEARTAMGTSMQYEAFFYNKEKAQDDTRRPLSGKQWEILEGNAEACLEALSELKGWMSDGFDPTVDKKKEFEKIVDQNKRNKDARDALAENIRMKQQAAAEESVAAIATAIGF